MVGTSNLGSWNSHWNIGRLIVILGIMVIIGRLNIFTIHGQYGYINHNTTEY